MMKVEAIVRPESLQTIIDRLDELGHSGITKTEIEENGKKKTNNNIYKKTLIT